MNRLAIIALVAIASVAAVAQSVSAGEPRPSAMLFALDGGAPTLPATNAPAPDLAPTAALPRMSPDLALATFQRRTSLQAQALAGYSAATVIRAELPRSSQQGEFELERHFSAPKTLTFKALHYVGDGFVKTNVIVRLLQSEVDHLQKDDPATTALGPENYKFSHKDTTTIAGRTVHDYQVKPRKKRPGLFKGHIYIDAYTGSLVRAEGRVVKSPSVFVSKIDFVQDYADIDRFTLPVHLHTEAKATLVGRTVIDVVNRDYQPALNPLASAAASGLN